MLPIVWLIVLGFAFYVPSWAFGEKMPPRTLSGIYVMFVVGWLGTVYLWTRDLHAPPSLASDPFRSPNSAAVVAFAFGLSLVMTGNGFNAVHELAVGRAGNWRKSVESRYTLLRRARDSDCVIPPLAPPTTILYSGEITDDIHDWHNVSVADFFNVKSVRLNPQLPPTTNAATASEADEGHR